MPERTGMETSLRERRGVDALPSPRPPFSCNISARSSPGSTHTALHSSANFSSLRAPHSPSPNLTPSMSSLTPSQAPSFAPSLTPSFTPSFVPSTDSRRGIFRRTHRASSSVSPPSSISTSQWQPAMPSTILNGEEKPPGHTGRSVSGGLQPKPKLQRKKSNASLLYQGLGRGLSRVGSVMRRGGSNNSNPSTPDDHSTSVSSAASSSVGSVSHPPRSTSRRPPPPKRCGSTTLQDLCEEAEAAAERDSAPKERSAPMSVYVPPPPNEQGNGVSRPFNVQHELHVTAELDGLPSEWLESLKAQGVTEHDLLLITSAQRRQRAVPRHPIVRTRTPIDTTRPPSPSASKYALTPASSPSPAKTESAVVASPTKAPTPPKKGSPRARTSTLLHLSTPTPTPSAQSSASQLSVPAQPRTRGRGISPTITGPPKSNRRSLSAFNERGVTVKRSASLLGKLLDDIDSKSSRPSWRHHAEMPRPLLSDLEEKITEVGEPSVPQSDGSDQLQKRLSDDLRGFHDITIPGEDGWAASILAAWDGDNALAQEVRNVDPLALARRLTQDGPHRAEAVSTPGPGTMPSSSVPSRSPTPDTSPFIGRLSKPRSASSLCIPSVDVDEVNDASSGYFIRRRSKSFDQPIVDRSTLYSPPPPPPHPQRNSSTAGDTPPTSFRSPHLGKLRASRDSFGVAHSISTRSSFIATSIASKRSHEDQRRPDVDEEEEHVHTDEAQCTPGPSPSRTSSELDLGTPPASDMSGTQSMHSKDHSLIHERLSVASAIEQARCRPYSPPPATAATESEVRHLSLPEPYGGKLQETPLSVDTLYPSPLSPLSTMVYSHSPTDDDFYDSYLGVGWCAACSSAAAGGNSVATASALGLSLTSTEHTCTLELGRHASVRSTASSYGADRASILSVGGTSQLPRMSSIASSTHSYNLHEVTVHRAYTRVLRRVPERSETYSSEAPSERGGSEADGDMSVSADAWESARQSMQSGSSGALYEAAWRVALRDACV